MNKEYDKIIENLDQKESQTRLCYHGMGISAVAIVLGIGAMVLAVAVHYLKGRKIEKKRWEKKST